MEYFLKNQNCEEELISATPIKDRFRVFIRSRPEDGENLSRLIFAYDFEYPVLALQDCFPQFDYEKVSHKGIFGLFLTRYGAGIAANGDSDKIREKKIIAYNLNELSRWQQASPVEFNLLRMFLLDAVDILRQWEPVAGYRIIIAKSLLSYLDSAPGMREQFNRRYNDLAEYFYHCMLFDPDSSAELKLDAIKRFLVLCFDEKNQDWFDRRKQEAGTAETADQDLEQLVSGCADRLEETDFSGTAVSITESRDEKRLLLDKAKSWLLSRYNLPKASQLALGKNSLAHRMFLWGPELLALPFVAALILSRFFIQGCTETPCAWSWLSKYVAVVPLCLAYFLICVGAAALCVHLYRTRKKAPIVPPENRAGGFGKSKLSFDDLRLLLPRLAAGIAVGYFFLLNDDAWGGIMSWWVRMAVPPIKSMGVWDTTVFFLKILLPLVGVLFYIFIEMRNVRGIHLGTKPLRFFLRGYSYAVLIGVFISDMFGEFLVLKIFTTTPTISAGHVGQVAFDGVLGKIYPEVILFHAPMAMFIGVFLQLLWQDKSLTDKI